MITRTAARRLAVAYNAFNEACDRNNDLQKVVWGNLLRDIQNLIGVFLITPNTLDMIISAAEQRRAA